MLEVPSTAVHYSGATATVLMDRSTKVVSIPVTTGVTTGGFTQITGGISVGQQVLVAGAATPRASGSGAVGRGGGGFGGGGFGGGGLGGGRGGAGG